MSKKIDEVMDLLEALEELLGGQEELKAEKLIKYSNLIDNNKDLSYMIGAASSIMLAMSEKKRKKGKRIREKNYSEILKAFICTLLDEKIIKI